MHFATQIDLDTSGLLATEAYCFVGFPNDPKFKSTKLTAWRATPFICAGTLGDLLPPLQNHDPRANVVVDVNPRALVDGRGEPASIPEVLGGISGGLIVRLPLQGGAPSIVAVQTSVFRSPERLLVKGTPWRYVLGLIDEELKGIRAAVRLLLPKAVR